VEVALLPHSGAVVRDGTDCTCKPLMFKIGEWCRFVSGVKNGEFDL
jgi:hypothetical protein